jgi:hypothetical protein
MTAGGNPIISRKRCKLIACEVLFREICYSAARCSNIIDITFMEKGLHDVGTKKMSEKLQGEIDKVDAEKYDTILLCYGLCNNGICGLHSSLPIVIPRAHDCITLLMGSKEKYKDYFDHNPGTFFFSPGWLERNKEPDDTQDSITTQLGMGKTYQEYVELYDEETAKYLFDVLGDWLKNYKKTSFINTKVGSEKIYREKIKQFAAEKNWEYEEVGGDTGLIYKLLNGDWNPEEFLILPPEASAAPSNDENIIKLK